MLMAIRKAALLILFVMVMAAAYVPCTNALNLSHFRGARLGTGLQGRKFLFKSTEETVPRPRILAEKIEPEPRNSYASRVLQFQVGQKNSDVAQVDIHESAYPPLHPRQPIVAPPLPPSNLPYMRSPMTPSNLPPIPRTWNGNAHTDYAPVTTHPPGDDDDYPASTTMHFHSHTDYDGATPHPPSDHDYPPSDPTTMDFHTRNMKVGNVHADYESAHPDRPIIGHDYVPGV